LSGTRDARGSGKTRKLVRALAKTGACAAAALAILLCPVGRSQPAAGYRNVAFAGEPGVQVVVSSTQFRRKKGGGYLDACPLNQGLPTAGAPDACDWISNPSQHLPQWVWIHFAGPRRIDKVVLVAGSMANRPVEFSGQVLPAQAAALRAVFHVRQAEFDPHTLSYTVRFRPVVTDNIRLVIERNAAATTPQSWTAELAQVEVYGVDAGPAASTAEPTNPSAAAAPGSRARLDTGLESRQAAVADKPFAPTVTDAGETVDIRTPWYRLVLDKAHPRVVFLSWDSLGEGNLSVNLLDKDGAAPELDPVFQEAMALGTGTLTRTGNVFHYSAAEVAPGAFEEVSILAGERGFDLALAARARQTMMMRGGLFRFHFAANETPTTFVGQPSKILNYVGLPSYLAAPDFGTAYITRSGEAGAFYRKPSAMFPATTYWVDVTPREPAGEDGLNTIGPQPWRTTLHFAVQRIEPLPGLVANDARLKRLPDYSLNMVQWRPDTGILSNSVMSIDCGLAILFYAEESVFAPHLENGISPMALVGASVERYFEGAPGYQMPNLNVSAPDWWSSRETAAYLIISAWYVVRTIGGEEQLRPWLRPLESLSDRLEAQFGADGLIYYQGRGTMWFDTYKYDGADAYSNAADYRAFRSMADLETLAGRTGQAERYRRDADRIQAAYFKSFYNARTGVLAGWRTREGVLHDYMFPWVNGFAIDQGLVPAAEAKAIMQRLLVKLREIDFHSYQLGLPTNLIPMSPDDYIPHTSGAPKQADGMDTWQIYMNGGATPAMENYFIQALYRTGQYEEGERLLWPLIGSYEKGTFNTGIQLPGLPQRNPVGSAFYRWDGSHGAGEGYLPEDWDGMEALFTGHYGIGFNSHGYYLEPWSPLKSKTVKLDLPYMGKIVPAI
jgi:hypothetical protein